MTGGVRPADPAAGSADPEARFVPRQPIEILPAGPVRARLAAPPSKSVTIRALLLAALAHGESLIRDPLRSEDTQAMRHALAAFGVGTEDTPEGWSVSGCGGALATPAQPVDCGLSGVTLRALTAVAALAPGPVTLTGGEGLRRRPVGPLVAALRALGVEVEDRSGFPPVTISGGGIRGGETTVDAGTSSQFVTALLIAAPYASEDVIVRAEGLAAARYVQMTARMMEERGAPAIEESPACWRVPAGRTYAPREVRVEYDASAAAHLFALAVATGGTLTVTNAAPATLQPDAGITEILAMMGARVRQEDEPDAPGDRTPADARPLREVCAVTVVGPSKPDPIRVDLSSMPDQVPTVAVLAALARGRTEIEGVAVARAHESDRIAVAARELSKLGLAVEERPGGLAIVGVGAPADPATVGAGGPQPGPPHRRWIDPHGDHRMAMAFAALGARVAGLVIDDPSCVAKTYPGFWEDLRRAGVSWRPAGAST